MMIDPIQTDKTPNGDQIEVRDMKSEVGVVVNGQKVDGGDGVRKENGGESCLGMSCMDGGESRLACLGVLKRNADGRMGCVCNVGKTRRRGSGD